MAASCLPCPKGVVEERPLPAEARAAGVRSDRIVWLGGPQSGAPFKQAVRVLEVDTGKIDANGRPDILLLATSRLDLAAELVGPGLPFALDRELFFRWLKCILGGRHLLANSRNGVTIQVYLAIIASLYYCVAAEQERVGKQLCRIFGGFAVEQAVVEAVLEALSPLRLEALREAAERLQMQRTDKLQHVELELERARYEADRCARQYQTVEPENRLVARTLEKRWNESLERVRALQQERAELAHSLGVISPEEHEQLGRLALDLPRLWNHLSASFDLKKRMLRTVIREIVVYVEKRTLRVLIHWQGGQHTELELRRRRPGEHR